MNDDDYPTLDDWIASRPECVRKLAAEFPPNTEITCNGVVFGVLGYTEDDMLIVYRDEPGLTYEEAMANKQYVHADHFRQRRSQ